VPVTLINEYSSTLSLTRHALPMFLDVLGLRWKSLRGMYELGEYAPGATRFADVARAPARRAA
jgi:hypothetical protein